LEKKGPLIEIKALLKDILEKKNKRGKKEEKTKSDTCPDRASCEGPAVGQRCAMTLFKRTELSLEDLEKLLVSLEGHSADFADKKRRLNELTEMADTLSQNCSKLRKAANEPDPAKRTYGEQMSRKVIEVCDRFDALQPKVSTVAEAVSAECREWEAEMAVKLEQEAKASAAAAAACSAAAKAEEKQKTEEKASTTPSAAAGAVMPASPKATSVVPQTVAASTQPQVMDKASTKPQEAPTPAAAKENQAMNKASATLPAASANEKQDKDKTEITPPAATSACAVTLNLKSNVAGEGTTSVTVASLDTSVMQLKEAIAVKMGHAADSQRLIFTGRVLDNSQPLSAYNIKSNCTLHLVVSKSLGAAKSPTKEGGGLGPPAGLVHGITGGAIELRQVLINAGPRLVVVDWMAPWCGPCRAIAPKIDDLASNNADVVFLKIDTEASGENKALAMDAQIQAFPTFHFYINSNRVAQVVSADLNKIVTTMNQHKPNIVSEAAAALGEADPAAADALVQKVKAALVKLKASCSSDQDFIAATKTFLSFIGNCVNNPTEAKYRRIRQGNPSFQSRLGSKVGGIEALKAFGFNEVSEGVPPEDYLILDSVLPEMVQVKELLEKAVPGGSAAAAAPASSLSSLSPAGGLGGLGGSPV